MNLHSGSTSSEQFPANFELLPPTIRDTLREKGSAAVTLPNGSAINLTVSMLSSLDPVTVALLVAQPNGRVSSLR